MLTLHYSLQSSSTAHMYINLSFFIFHYFVLFSSVCVCVWKIEEKSSTGGYKFKVELGRGDKLENFDLIFSPLLKHGRGY